jgi:hypothetical protein
MKPRCVCGCGRRAGHDHHVITRQELRRRVSPERSYRSLQTDRRNIVRVAFDCHFDHHAQMRPFDLRCFPDAVFEFAGELLGAYAYDYLSRYYAGHDPRLDALLG